MARLSAGTNAHGADAPASITKVDVLILGAGLSGIGMACHLTRNCPRKRYLILERRQDLGGTWDLFRYPGIRSDSDMATFGYRFKPWKGARVLADGQSIKQYLRETAREYGVEANIRYGLKVLRADWSSHDQQWTVDAQVEATGERRRFICNFFVGCAGYYNQDAGYRPHFPGEEDFQGQIIHPQHWPERLDYRGKQVVIIGSGATAITLMPSMAATAGHVTLLQRSPSYLLSVPATDPITQALQRVLPEKLAYRITRERNIGIQRLLYRLSRRHPQAMRKVMLALVRQQLGGKADMRHFSPRYMPWDERLCAVASGDLFKAIRRGTASMATGVIDRFTCSGIRLQSGEELTADLIVTATGLNIQMLGGVSVTVDTVPLKVNAVQLYKSVMVENVPNAGMIFGYTNLPWTMKADIAAEYLCRLINHMDRHQYATAVARDLDASATAETFMGVLRSGYVLRAQDQLPRQGSKKPWMVTQDYPSDVQMLRHDPIEEPCLHFEGARAHAMPKQPRRAASRRSSSASA